VSTFVFCRCHTLTSHETTTSIWEKKYGRNANHIKKEREEEGEARKKRAEKMKHSAGKRSGQARSRGLPSRIDLENRPKDSGWNNENEGQLGASGKKEASLHPSWEAARRKKAAPMIVPSAGKKIIF
jgi:BUD22